jgi:hypothetical protein
LDVPIDIAWNWLADLDRLTVANLLHRRAHYITKRHDGPGATLIVDHSIGIGPLVPRRVRISHWDAGKRIRWTDVDQKRPTYLFPHSEEFRLERLSDGATLLTDEVKGSLNLPIPLVGQLVDLLFERIFVAPVVRQQVWYLRRQIRLSASGLTMLGEPNDHDLIRQRLTETRLPGDQVLAEMRQNLNGKLSS